MAVRLYTPRQGSTGSAATTSLKRQKIRWAALIHNLPSALTSPQMLQMEYEKEVVLNICHRVEMHEQQQQFDDNVVDKGYDLLEGMFDHSHIHLGSRQRGLKVPSYETDLEETLGFYGFSDSLAAFLRDYARVEVYGSDFYGDGFEGHQHCIRWWMVGFALVVPFSH